MSGEEIFSLIFWGFWILLFILTVYVAIDDARHGVSNGITNSKPFITDDMSPQEKWHRNVTLFGDPTPWDDDHTR